LEEKIKILSNNQRSIATRLERLMTLDIACRGVIKVLSAAGAELQGSPLLLLSAEALLQKVKPGDAVFIATGWVDQPLVDPGHGETDGPPGAVALARALRLICKARPIILTDACLVDGVSQLARAAGFQCVEPEHLHYSISMNKLLTLSVLPFPESWDDAQKEAIRLFDQLKPSACIAIERGGMNEQGIIHNMAGMDTSATQAKLDALFQLAAKRDTLTLGIGDGGNEIGMANIADCIRGSIPFGRECACGCGGGLVPNTIVNFLLPAAVSNWGAYALASMLAVLSRMKDALPDPAREKRVLEAAAVAGFHDAIYGEVCGSVDGSPLETQLAIVQLMREAVKQYFKRHRVEE
jgi:hypothetical protein